MRTTLEEIFAERTGRTAEQVRPDTERDLPDGDQRGDVRASVGADRRDPEQLGLLDDLEGL